MIRTVFAVALLTLFTAPLSAQDQPALLGIRVGMGAPMGDFGSTDVDKEGAGLATEGAVFDLDLAYRMNKHFGVFGLVRGTGNATNAKVVSRDYEALGLDVKVEPGTWVTVGLYAGGIGFFPMNERWAFTARAAVGYASVTSPVLKLGTRDGAILFRRESAVVGAPAYLFGVGIKGDVGARLSVLVNLDMMGAEANFDEVKTDGMAGPVRVSFDQSIALVSFAAGVGYRF